ncbi:MAG: HEAT repeat domain-containing protein [Candidatus Sabulitectum sp.]|nr:HEAT repeat domain-containing protein [Candidatus Sabulitectum sp.]
MTDTSPLTGLPGNLSIRQELRKHMISGVGTVAYVDIIDFKPFNDYYGFALGDSVIRRLGQILEESIPDFFVGHIGGDDFICIGDGSEFTRGVETARQKFRSVASGFYTARDRESGGIETFDREGSYKLLPLLDISVVFTDPKEKDISVESLARKAGRAKKLLKGEQIVEPVFPLLEQAVHSGYGVEGTKALVEACGVLREEGAVTILATILNGQYSWKLRKSAALALGYIGNSNSNKLLLDALNDSNPHVRTRAVEGLVFSIGRESGKLLVPLLDDSSTWVRRAALRGIGYAGWDQGLHFLRDRATGRAPGAAINTSRERTAALDGISMLAPASEAGFLAGLCTEKGYFPGDAAFKTLCSVGTDVAACEVLRRNDTIPGVLNLTGMNHSNLRKLEALATRSLGNGDSALSGALRFLEGFSLDFNQSTIAELKKYLGVLSGDMFRRLVILLDSRSVPADRSCIARVASRIDSGQMIGTSALSAFLGWVARRGGVSPGSLLKSFLRGDRRAVAASAALAVRTLASRDLTRMQNGETIS